MMTHPPPSAHDGASPSPAHPIDASSPYDAAASMVARGWVVFPCDRPGAGNRCTGMGCHGADPAEHERGKHPQGNWGSVDLDECREHLGEWFGDPDGQPMVNVAIACGASHLVVLDEDAPGVLAALAASLGEVVPETFTVSTGRAGGGRHLYFAEPLDEQGVRLPIGNASGALPDKVDVRGGAGPSGGDGGYVIGPGAEHRSGDLYRITSGGPAVTLPEWLVKVIMSPGPPGPPEGVAGRAGDGDRATTGTRWDDRPRYGSRAELLAQFARHCAEVTEPGQPFRRALFLAALDGWRLVDLGEIDEDAMLTEVERCVERVWADPKVRAAAGLTGPYTGPDDHDHEHVFRDARPAATASRWIVAEGTRSPRTFGDVPVLTSVDGTAERTTAGNRAVGDDHAESAADGRAELSPAARIEVDRRDARKEADLYVARRDAVKIRDVTAAEFFAMPPPRYLAPGMIHRDGIAVLFGAPHSGKSFLALDIALSFASGKPWCLGEGGAITLPDGGPGVVHYIMAEAPGTNTGRGNAWLQYHGITVADLGPRFHPVLDSFLLTEAGIAGYLRKVARDRPDLIIYDTRSAMFAGKESQGEDYAEMLRAMRTIRRVNDKECAQLTLDHTGLSDPNRPRGNNAWEAGSDSMVLITKDKEGGLHRVAVKRDRSAAGDGGAEWGIRREPVMVDGRSEAVLLAADLTGYQPFPIEWPVLTNELPDGIREAIDHAKGPDGKAAPAKAIAKMIMLIMRAAADTIEGHTQGDLRAIISAHTGKPEKSIRGSVSDAITTLVVLGMVERIARGRVLLTAPFRPEMD